jgi:hypothetical protein
MGSDSRTVRATGVIFERVRQKLFKLFHTFFVMAVRPLFLDVLAMRSTTNGVTISVRGSTSDTSKASGK